MTYIASSPPTYYPPRLNQNKGSREWSNIELKMAIAMLLQIGTQRTEAMLGRSAEEIKAGFYNALDFSESLETSVQWLNSQITRMDEEHKSLTKIQRELQNENIKIKKDHEDLTLKYVRIENETQQVEKENKSLTKKYRELDNDNLRVKRAILPFIHEGKVPPTVLYENPEDYTPPESSTANTTKPYHLVTCPHCKEDGGAGGRCSECAGSGTIRKFD
jgi:TolA-binding protein